MSKFVIVCIIGFFSIPALFAAPPLDSRALPSGGGENFTILEARNKLLAAADTYRGTPYRYSGTNKKGVDCSGLIYASFKDSLDISVPRSTPALYNWTEKIGEKSLQPGDLVFFITTGPGISHAGIYVGEGRFIHSASDGPMTGVIYSSLDETYWRKTFAGAGRALPELSSNETVAFQPPPPEKAGADPGKTAVPAAGETIRPSVNPIKDRISPAESPSGSRTNALTGKGFMAGFAIAPSWNGFVERNNPNLIRGITVQGRFAWKGVVFGQPLMPAFEIRPEWDNVLGVFRMSFALSLGFSDKVRFFAGPAFSVGAPTMRLQTGDRRYTGGNSWLGTLGVTLAPLSIPVSKGSLDLYGELAWQSYYGAADTEPNWKADMNAGLSISTGLRYTWEL
ncbi:MAG: C40 family peptidase [Treponema sp.]|jgi:probable lipoprotein NlpC|nr:C40 family peptidase [Treponema sp.]